MSRVKFKAGFSLLSTKLAISKAKPYIFDRESLNFSSIHVVNNIVEDLIENAELVHIMKEALKRWEDYAVERLLIDTRITTLGYLSEGDHFGLPIQPDEFKEPVIN
jgi:hypothetical protein